MTKVAPKKRMTNPGDFVQDPNYVAPDKEKEQKIYKLAQMLTDNMDRKFPGTMNPNHQEYWMLDAVLTKEEAQFLINFKKRRVTYNVKSLAKMNNMTEQEAKEVADHLAWVGVLETERNDKGELVYQMPMFVPGSAEFMMANDELVEQHPEIATFFNLMTQEPLEPTTKMVPLGGAGLGMHVIPVEKAIESESQSMSIEHISHWLDKYEGKLSVGVCTCRRMQRMRNEGDGSIEGEYCIALGDTAEFTVNTNRARYITKEEALEICERAERHGYVHQTTNIDGEDKIIGLCNCAPGVCNAIRTSQLYNTPNMSRSAYRAHVEKENCVACGKCVEVCPVGAVKLGQRLKTKTGYVKYPLSELPDETPWDESKWNPNYRETAKINTYETGTAPCKSACPAHIAVQGYLKMAKEGRYMDALKLIKKDNPLPAVCGAICNRKCESKCTRQTIDESIAIDEVKKFISAQELNAETRYVPLCENCFGEMWDEYPIAVIGAGPAGISCAYYLREKGYPVTVFEKESRPGGMLMNGIPNFRLEKDVVEAEIDILKEMGVEFKYNVEVGKDVTLDELRKEGYRAFFVGIGAQGGRFTGMNGEDLEGVEAGVTFLKDMNLDSSKKLEGDVVVIGGGNVAVDVARTALRATNGTVTMLCLEDEDHMPADKLEVEEAKEEGVIVKCGYGPVEILGEDGKASKTVFKKCLSVFDENHKFNPKFDENDTIELDSKHVLLSIGQTIVWDELLAKEAVEFNRNKTIKADKVTLQAGDTDIFVGGDCYSGPLFAINAIASGKQAAESIHRYVHPGQSLTIARDKYEFKQFDTNDVVVEQFDNSRRQRPSMKDGNPVETFKDLRLPLTEDQVKKECSRCLQCGLAVVDLNRCIGCGLCTTRCEFDAIHLQRDLPDASRMIRSEDKMSLIAPYIAERSFKIVKNKLHKK